MALTGKNQTKSFASNKFSIDQRQNESDFNLQKINYLKETYQQMALYQSELAKNSDNMRKSAATAGSRKKMSVMRG